MAFATPSAPASAVRAAAVIFPVPPPSAVALVSVVTRARRAPVPAAALRAMQAAGNNARRRGAALVAASAALDDLRPAIDADLRAYLESQIVTSDQMSPAALLTDVMSRPVQVDTPGQRLAEVDVFFTARQYSGLPVVDEEGRCIGVISKTRPPSGMESTVGEVMSSPITLVMMKMESTVGEVMSSPITLTLYKTVLGNKPYGEVMSSPPRTLTLYKTVLEAAALMLKNKVHRIPVVNEQRHVISKVLQTPSWLYSLRIL